MLVSEFCNQKVALYERVASLEGDNFVCWYLSSVIKKWPYMRGGLS